MLHRVGGLTPPVGSANRGSGNRGSANRASGNRCDGGDLKRESSLLPGEVRTPTMVVSLSQAWGDSSADWAAPGSSAVWDEEAPSRHSAQSPLTGYGHSDVWASATGSPLMGDELNTQASFGQAVADSDEAVPDAAQLAAAALEAIIPQQAAHVDPEVVLAPVPQRVSPQPRYSTGAHYRYENRFGTIHEAPPTPGDVTQLLNIAPPAMAQPTLQPTYFTVQEVQQVPVPVYPQPPAAAARAGPGGPRGVSPGAGHHGPGGSSYVPRLEEESVAQRIIASAGLPLSMTSLIDYIHGGQPRAVSHAAAMGTTQSGHRNYPNLNEPPPEDESAGGRGGGFGPAAGGRGGRGGGRGGYGQQQQQQPQGRWGPTSPSAAEETRFAVRGSDAMMDSQSSQEATSQGAGGFVVSAGGGPHATARSPAHSHGHGHGARHKSESEYLSDLLHFHANFFPPPPPPRVPKDERRNRAELWFHYASKWDITHRLPPPPRTPLPEMELEYRLRLISMTRVPYHGDGWLQMSERWFDVTQALFDFPDENVGDEIDFNVVLQQAVLS